MIQIIEETGDGLDRIALCQLFLERFNRSRLTPRALLLLGEEAGRAAAALTQHAHRRLKTIDERKNGADTEAYYLNDPGLDRYSRLRVAFRFDASQSRYAYDGKAYRDIIRRLIAKDSVFRGRIVHQRIVTIQVIWRDVQHGGDGRMKINDRFQLKA